MDKELMIVDDGAAALSLPKKIRKLAVTADSALKRCEHATKIWTHSRSGMVLRNMTIGGEYSPMRRMRQIAAELQKKKNAMTTAKYSILKKQKEAEIKLSEAKVEKNKLKREYLELEAEEIAVMATLAEGPYIGAMREVVELSRLHDALVKQIRKKHGKFDEEVFEKEESEYWVRRSFTQSLRDLRQSGIITSGNQEVLEQIGLDPAVIKKLLVAHLKISEGGTNPCSEGLEKFIEDCAKRYSMAAPDKMKRLGLPCDIENSHLMLDESTE